MSDKEDQTPDEYIMDVLCKNAVNFGSQLISMKAQEASLISGLKNVKSLVMSTAIEIKELEKKGVNKPDLEAVKKAMDEEAQKRAGGQLNG